jgi:hypothetical protein
LFHYCCVNQFEQVLLLLYTYAPKLACIVQDHMTRGSHPMFTQAGYNDPSQDESSQMQYGMAPPGALQSQVTYLSAYFVHANYEFVVCITNISFLSTEHDESHVPPIICSL